MIEKLKARIEELDAALVQQEGLLNQIQANIFAIKGAKNEVEVLIKIYESEPKEPDTKSDEMCFGKSIEMPKE